MTSSGSFERAAEPIAVPTKNMWEAMVQFSRQWALAFSSVADSVLKRGGMPLALLLGIYKILRSISTEEQQHQFFDKYILLNGLLGTPLSIYFAFAGGVCLVGLGALYTQNKRIKRRYRQRIKELRSMLRNCQLKAGLVPMEIRLPLEDEP